MNRMKMIPLSCQHKIGNNWSQLINLTLIYNLLGNICLEKKFNNK
jgi:hypothetical protein